MSRSRALTLMTRKDALEAELQAQYSILSSNNSTMNTPLVDPEGFPRSDIDVWAVRHARVRVIELRNDLTALTDLIKRELENVGAEADGRGDASMGGTSAGEGKLTNGNSINGENVPEDLVAFAMVDGVAPNSPAASADLRREDQILRFGRLTASDFIAAPRSLQPLAALVAEFENRALDVVVRRGENVLTLNFIPRSGWGGRGLLGCHIVPV